MYCHSEYNQNEKIGVSAVPAQFGILIKTYSMEISIAR